MRQPKQLKHLIDFDKCSMYRCPMFTDEDYMWENKIWTDDDFCLEESDFCPPPDDRVWKTNIEDIEGDIGFVLSGIFHDRLIDVERDSDFLMEIMKSKANKNMVYSYNGLIFIQLSA